MKKLVISCLVVLTVFQIASAQDKSDIKAEMKEQREAFRNERQSQSRSGGGPTGQAVTAADVGEPDSFGKTALFLGIAQSGVVILDPACDPAEIGPLGPDDHCITVADPSVPVPATTFNDIARITTPGKSVSNIVYAISNNTVSYDMFNPGPTPTIGRISYIPTITLESEALNDPSLINPLTNLPFNGSFTTGIGGTYSTNKTLAVAASEFLTHSYTRANTSGFSRSLFAGLNLPPAVVDQIYKKPITLRLNVRVSSQLVRAGTLLLTARFLGN